MRVIIAGSRTLNDPQAVSRAVTASGFKITEVVSGCARGADYLGWQWAEDHGVLVKAFRAAWKDLSAPDAVIKTNQSGGRYDALAGFRRNRQMAEYADALIAIWDGQSPGTKNMIRLATEYGLKTFIYPIGK